MRLLLVLLLLRSITLPRRSDHDTSSVPGPGRSSCCITHPPTRTHLPTYLLSQPASYSSCTSSLRLEIRLGRSFWSSSQVGSDSFVSLLGRAEVAGTPFLPLLVCLPAALATILSFSCTHAFCFYIYHNQIASVNHEKLQKS